MILIHKKTCRLSPGGVTISAFDHIKKDTEISRKNMLPCGSLPSSFSLSSSSFTKNPFIYRFTHSQWEEQSLFIPPSLVFSSLL